MAKKMALALAPPATTPPLQQAWLRDRAEIELRNDQDTHSRFLQQAAQEGRNGPMTTWWLYWVSNRQWKTQYDAAIAAGQTMVAANHQYSVRTSLLLAWIQHNAGKSADALATLRKTSGETPSTWSREQIAVAAYACINVGDRAMYDLLIGEALARGDGERQFNLMVHFGPKEEWRASIWKRMASESINRTILAEAYLQLGDTAKVIAEYPDALDQCERALCAQVAAARNAKNAADEEKAVELLLNQVLTRGCTNPGRTTNEVWPAYDARPKADPALKKRWLQAMITIGSYHSLWSYQRLSEMVVASDPVEASKLLQNMVRTRGRNHREGFDEVFVEVKKETAAGRYGVASATFAHMAEWFNAVDDDRRAMARRAAAEALAKIGGGAAATALIDDRDPNAPLLRAAALLAAGDEDEAYRQATSNPKLLDANITTLGSDLLLLIARNRIREGEFPFARDLLQRLIQARSTDKSAAETVARAHLLLGDIEFRNANYPAALLEFQAITAGWPGTRAALDAGLRTGDTHLATRREADARKAY